MSKIQGEKREKKRERRGESKEKLSSLPMRWWRWWSIDLAISAMNPLGKCKVCVCGGVCVLVCCFIFSSFYRLDSHNKNLCCISKSAMERMKMTRLEINAFLDLGMVIDSSCVIASFIFLIGFNKR